MGIEVTLDEMLKTLKAIEANTKPVPPVIIPPVVTPPTETWELISNKDAATRTDLSLLPLNTEMPNAEGTPTWTLLWNPWCAGTGSSDGNRNNASVQIINKGPKNVLQCRIWDTFGRDVGARAFITNAKQWNWWGTRFEGKTARIRAKALYLPQAKPLELPGGDGTFFQTFFEFKTLDTPMTAIGVFVHTGNDGKLYHYLSLAEKTFGLDQQTDPLVFGEYLDYELLVEFSRNEDAKVIFKYKNTVIEGRGRTLNKSNGQGGGAFLVYSNELKNQEVVVQYSDIIIERK